MNEIFELIKYIQENIKEYVTPDGFIDPIDKYVISAHYATSHLGAGMVLLGKKIGDEALIQKGCQLAKVIMDSYAVDSKLPEYHFDFNNFALCLIVDALAGEEFADCVKEHILSTNDSNHETVNWLPMRMFVNMHRFEWSGDSKYKLKAEALEKTVKSAIYKDGFIDDRIPKGVSFNLQYDVFTTAVLMLYQNKYGLGIDTSVLTGALLGAVCPDGDINYMGRGTNQIFAWGAWIYILSKLSDKEEINRAVRFMCERAKVSTGNNNILLNNHRGVEKQCWWDYHYSSVYTAHLYMWLVLAYVTNGDFEITPKSVNTSDSGIKILKTAKAFIMIFSGRKEYLAEKGPKVEALYLEKYGPILKGAFGPFGGSFGNKYADKISVVQNFFGVIKTGNASVITQNRLFKKLKSFIKLKSSLKLTPMFGDIQAKITGECISVEWRFKRPVFGAMNIPVLKESSLSENNITLLCDKKEVPVKRTGTIINQYGESNLLRSAECKASEWEIIIN